MAQLKGVQDHQQKNMALHRAVQIARQSITPGMTPDARAEITMICRYLERIEDDIEALAVIRKTGKIPQ